MSISKKLLKSIREVERLPNVHTADDYKKLPIELRSKKVWWWLTPWFIMPGAMRMDLSELKDGLGKKQHEGNGEFAKCYAFLKKEFPLQYFLREGIQDSKIAWWLRMKKMKIEELWYTHVDCFFKPRQKWLTDVIGKTYRDKPELIRDVMYAFIINLVEEEKFIEHWEWGMKPYPEWDEEHKKHYMEEQAKRLQLKIDIEEIYDWAKYGRDQRDKDSMEALAGADDRMKEAKDRGLEGREYLDFVYGENNKIDEEINNKDSIYMKKIIDIREHLWT